MTAIAALLEHPAAQALAWALINFLWQGAAIGIAAWLIFRYARLSASSRYAVGVMALAIMLGAPLVTFAWLVRQAPPAPPAPASVVSVAPAKVEGPMATETARPPAPRVSALDGPFEPFVVALWLSGVVVLSLRLFGGWMLTRRFATRGLVPVGADIDAAGRRIAGDLGLTRLVKLFESAAVQVPVTIGWIKPVVLFPMSAISGLSGAQVEALLAHELAHIRRHDYLVNLLQSAVETLLFYHPAVWWISKRVRTEREHCCDDLVVALCDRVVYVRALTDLATLVRTPRMALAATDGSLMRRVRRLLGDPAVERDAGAGWLSGLFAVLLVGGAVPVAVASMSAPETKPKTVVDAPTQGVPSGVQTGAPGGVSGGVQGGVPGGVASGVSGGIGRDLPLDAPIVPARRELDATLPRLVARDQQSAEQQAATQRLLEARQRALETQTAIELQQLDLQLQRALSELDAKRSTMEVNIDELYRALERAKAQLQKALVSPEIPAGIEAKLKEAMVQMQSLDRDRRLVEQETQLKRQSIQQARELERVTTELQRAQTADRAARQIAEGLSLQQYQMAQEYEQLRQTYALALQDQEKLRRTGADDRALTQKIEELRRALDKMTLAQAALEAQARNRMARPIEESLALEQGTELGRDERARPGDNVLIEIAGQETLRKDYLVSREGSIKLPFLNDIKVEGLTPSQIRDAITREVQKYVTNPKVSVTVRRPRRE